MVLQFVAIFITFGLFKKLSEDKEKQMRNASGIKTFIFGVLSLMVLMFYIKTNEIPIIKQQVDISGIQVACDSTGKKIQDKVEVEIVSRFDNNRQYRSLLNFLTSDYDEDAKENALEKYKLKNQDYGGIGIKLHCYYDSTSKIMPIPENLKLLDNVNINILRNYSHCYNLTVINSRISSFSPFQGVIAPTDISICAEPFFPIIPMEVGSLANYKGNFPLSGTNDYFGNNAIVLHGTVATKESLKTGIYDFDFPFISNVLNSMNIFSAADLSQCIYEICIYSSCDLDQVCFNFDIPVELLPNKYKPSQTDIYDIVFRDSTTLANIRNHVIPLYFKFPTMQNIQLVRQLVLTTVLTALLSLFLSNLFFLIRKMIHRKSITSKRLGFLQVWKIRHYWDKSLCNFTYILFSILGLLTIMRWCNCFIIVDYEYSTVIDYVFIILVILVVMYYVRKLRKLLKSNYVTSSSTQNLEESSYMKELLEKERIEREDNERVFEEHLADFCLTEEIENEEDNQTENEQE